MGVYSEETQTLLPPQQVVASQTVAVAVDDHMAGERDWEGSCAAVCGRCDATGLSSFALAYFMPCVAFGVNAKRALMGSAWLHGCLYVVFFLVWRAIVNACTWNMYIQCGVFDNQLDVTYNTGEASLDGHRKQLAAQPRFHDNQSPECRASIVTLGASELLLVVFVFVGIVYAARRRTLLRRQLGIAGCWVKDLALWCFCAPCALCQETRTLAANNVENGVWHGPTRFAVPMAAPAAEEVSKV